MKMTKKELIDHLEEYPDDFELNLAYYFMVNSGTDEKNESLYCATVNLPIQGTAADQDTKQIRFVLDDSSHESLKRIEGGEVKQINAGTRLSDEEKEELKAQLKKAS